MSMRILKFVGLYGISGARLLDSGEVGLILDLFSLGKLVAVEMTTGIAVTA